MPTFSEAPMVVFWEMTRACALKCRHCRAVAQPKRHPLELKTEEGFRLLDDLSSFTPTPIVILTGGDPFMRRDVFDLLAYGMGLGLRMSLSPSVTSLVTEEALRKLKELGLSRLSFSLDGASAEAHDAFRGIAGSFDQTVARMRDALDAGLALQVNTVVSRHSHRDLARIADLLAGFPRMVLWDVFFLVPTGRGEQDDVISAGDHESVFQWLHGLGSSVPFGIKTTLGQHYRRVALQNAMRDGTELGEVWSKTARTATNDGKGVCFVSHVGDIYPSGFLPVRCGTVRRSSVVEVYQSDPVFQALRDPEMLKGKCGRCPFRSICGGCRARSYACTGDYLAPEPFCVFEPD
ncbi:MAG: TIGR04053 family radical SAM/SPASM domain-containing protein [Chloroflexi bacterium]|nr:TIGR04053 family radical SAM/SPASM domain-containing protein [Chloroflexota bacterium]